MWVDWHLINTFCIIHTLNNYVLILQVRLNECDAVPMQHVFNFITLILYITHIKPSRMKTLSQENINEQWRVSIFQRKLT